MVLENIITITKGIFKTIDPIYEEINKLPNREIEDRYRV